MRQNRDTLDIVLEVGYEARYVRVVVHQHHTHMNNNTSGDKPQHMKNSTANNSHADMILEYDTLFTKNTTEEYNRLEEQHSELTRLRSELEKRVKDSDAVKRALAIGKVIVAKSTVFQVGRV